MNNRKEIEQIVRLHHICLELMGVISEYRSMPCGSLESRMFGTVDRYVGKVRENAPTLEQIDQLRAIHAEELKNVLQS